MIKYLVIKYFNYSYLISLLTLAGVALISSFGHIEFTLGVFWKSVFMGGSIGAFYIYKHFSNLNYWVLFSNLKINRYLYLGLLYIAYQLILLIITFTVRIFAHGV